MAVFLESGCVIVLLVYVMVVVGVGSEPTEEKQALLSFLSKTPHANRVQWNESESACDWVGVACDANRSFVYSLRLPGVGLVGPIPPNSIGKLSQLRVLSLRSNRLSGQIPSDFSNLTLLRSLYLQNNELSGEFPASVTAMNRLTRLDLSSNNFTGTIPFAVNNLTHLTGLFLQNNGFSGILPNINAANLVNFNVSNNKLNGTIPSSLTRFNSSSFAGNLDLCGGPLPPCNPFFPSPAPSPSVNPPPPPPHKKSKRLSTAAIVGIAVGAALLLLLLLLFLLLCLRKRHRRQPGKSPKPTVTAATRTVAAEAGTSSSKDDITGGSAEAERNKLVFFEGGVYSFDLEDLLRASAEVLGKGSVGTSYKAVLEEGTTVVVKRLKEVAVSKREFEMQMEVLGKIKHDNVVPLRAFYYSKDEKLLVYDFMPAGSLSALLHGSRGSGRTPLDWDNRMKIAVSAARGIAYLHVSGKVVHGNIKSSNILLRPDQDACISDFGLNPLFGTTTPPNRVAGYRAPEVVETRKVTFKSDVYSFGVLLLELLTGKAPNQASLGEEGIDLPRWVQSVVREEWTAEVFDVELMRYQNIEEGTQVNPPKKKQKKGKRQKRDSSNLPLFLTFYPSSPKILAKMAVDSALTSPLGPPACDKDAKALQFIEEITRNADLVQERVLAEILSRNAEVEYLKRYKLDGATDRDTFKSKLPVITYEDLQPEIQRIANGDRSNILSAHPISEFLTSSGTSAGERKLMPTIKEELDRRQMLYSLLMPVMNLCVPGLDKGKGLYFLFVKSETKTPGGLLARPVLTSYYKSDHFKTRPYDPYNVYTSPNEAILCADSFQSMYTQMLCGLLDRLQVLRLGAVFASGLLRAIRFLQLHWQSLANDIETGTLSPKITDPSIRNCMAGTLKPDSELADFIRNECSKQNWEGIITRVWPNTKYLDVIVTGAMAQYIPTLDYYSGGLPMACTMYASSECYFGLNLNPMCKPSEVSYTIIPNMAYFEFLPHEPGSTATGSAPRLVDLVDVEVGKEYELVITTYAGLYRYRVGDILRVTGFHNAAPQFHFVRRKNVLLSIDSDKTDEAELQNAVQNASQLLREFNTSVVEYTSYADTTTIPGHYVIYWELLVKDSANSPSEEVLNQCCLAMENSLNSVYRQGRVADNSIGPLELRVVRNGTFEELMDYAISRGASINQYKVPRCVNFTPILELLDSRVVSAHLSPALPRWSPERRR